MAAVPELTPYALPVEALGAESEKSSLSAVEAGVVDEKRLLRRIDLRILPFVWWSYCVMRVDVGNISNGEFAEACRRTAIADPSVPLLSWNYEHRDGPQHSAGAEAHPSAVSTALRRWRQPDADPCCCCFALRSIVADGLG